MYINELVYYAIGGAADNYRVIRYERVKSADYTIENERQLVLDVLEMHPDIKQMFVVTNRYSWRKDFNTALKDGSMAAWICFKDLLERCGREIDILPMKKVLMID